MSMFVMTIHTDNDAFAGDVRTETARLVADAAVRIDTGAWSGRLLDYNGNPVGSFDFVSDDTAAAFAAAALVGLEGADPEGAGHPDEALDAARDLAGRFQ